MRTILAAVAFLSLAACEKPVAVPVDNGAAATAFVPPATQPPAPIPGQAHQVPITAYVGKYPTEVIGGVTFFDRTEVANALIGAVGDEKLRRMIVGRGSVAVPIFRRGTMVAAHGCEAHRCDDHNWTFLVAPDGGTARACFHDAAAMADTSRWYNNDKPVVRRGGCPSA